MKAATKDIIEQIYEEDEGPESGIEHWVRWTDEPETWDVSALGIDASAWLIWERFSDRLRWTPLEHAYLSQMYEALRSVDGVVQVNTRDPKEWVVYGNARGEALVRAMAGVVDRMTYRAQTPSGPMVRDAQCVSDRQSSGTAQIQEKRGSHDQ